MCVCVREREREREVDGEKIFNPCAKLMEQNQGIMTINNYREFKKVHF